MNLWQILSFTSLVLAHSWIDTIYSVANPSLVGYPRNYAGHDASTSITEYKVLVRDPTLPVCGPSQQSATYSSQYPKLVVSAGSEVTATYLENGHVTKDKLPPDNLPHPGNYSWYISPKSGSLTTFGDLTDATRLSGPSPFDDGKCAVDAAGIQGRPGPITCLSKFTIPATLAAGDYQLVWWWDFTKLTQMDPSYTEYYTTCLDISVTPTSGSSNVQALAAVAAASLSSPRYANVSYTPTAYIAVAAASTQPVEKDILIVTSEDVIMTSTYLYEHPVAALPTAQIEALAKTVTSVATIPTSPSSTLSSPDYLATMYVNPDDGSLQPFNLVADLNGVLREVQVSVPQAAPSSAMPLFSAPVPASIFSQSASSMNLPNPFASSPSAPTPSSNSALDNTTVEEIVTIYVPTYITVDESCTATATAAAVATATPPEQHTTVTMTKTITAAGN